MSKLKVKMLLKQLENWKEQISWNKDWGETDEQAHQQIKEMIQKPEKKPKRLITGYQPNQPLGNVKPPEGGTGVLPKKRALTVDEIISKYPESVRILLRELLLKIENLQKKPEVMEEFVEKWNQVIAERVNVQMKKDFIREEIGLVYPGTENLTQMLKEAGVEIAGSKDEERQSDNNKD